MMKFEYVFPGEATEASELAIVRLVHTFIESWVSCIDSPPVFRPPDARLDVHSLSKIKNKSMTR